MTAETDEVCAIFTVACGALDRYRCPSYCIDIETFKRYGVEMNSLLIGLDLARRATGQEALSARPGAPVVTHVDRVPVFGRTRKVVAGGLRHLADVVVVDDQLSLHAVMRRGAWLFEDIF